MPGLMKMFFAALPYLASIAACTAPMDVGPFANLAEYADAPNLISLSGYLSEGQETVGFYPRQNLELRQGEECVFIHPSVLEAHDLTYGQRVTLTGRIGRTRCHESNTVCFQVCDSYYLDVTDVQIER